MSKIWFIKNRWRKAYSSNPFSENNFLSYEHPVVYLSNVDKEQEEHLVDFYAEINEDDIPKAIWKKIKDNDGEI